MMFTADTSKARSQLSHFIKTLESAVEAGLTQAGHDGAQKARTNTLYTPRSAQGLRSRTEFQSKGRFEKHVVANTFYGV